LQAFFDSLQRDQETYFAMTLVEKPQFGYHRSYPLQDQVIFGVLTRRTDGKFGRLCFEDSSHASHKTIFRVCDGFDRQTLQLDWDGPIESNEELGLNPYDCYRHRRIKGIHLDEQDLRPLIANCIAGHLKDDLGYELRNAYRTPINLSKERAGKLEHIRSALHQLFPVRTDEVVGKQIMTALTDLDAMITCRVEVLKKELAASEQAVANARAEIAKLSQ
jgi:hypothetical protein